MSKVSKFVPLVGTICGAAILISDSILNQKVNENMFMIFIAATVGGSSAIGFAKRWRK